VIFWILSLCVLYSLFSGLANHITVWTWIAVAVLLVQSIVLVSCGWTCPLTLLAERKGAARGSVTDIFLPKWFAGQIFRVCGTLYGVALLLLAWRIWK
jgi:hypothetical protein